MEERDLDLRKAHEVAGEEVTGWRLREREESLRRRVGPAAEELDSGSDWATEVLF